MPRLQRRERPSKVMMLASPLIAAAMMLVTGYILFSLMGKNPLHAFWVFFIKPWTTLYGFGELLLKATPLILCGLGLAIGFRARVFNIGAEGQFTLGAIAAGGVALYFQDQSGWWILALMMLAGVLGGMAWAAIPAFLRTRFNTNEILVTLMLVYVAQHLLDYLVQGPWRDPAGFNFPQSPMFTESETMPALIEGLRVNWSFVIALVLVAVSWFFSSKMFAGFRMEVGGQSPAAARYAGFSEKKAVWFALLVSGGLAGFAGMAEVAGPIGQLQPIISPGYGFAAIIVAYVGRLHPLGVLLAGLLLSLLYLGGDAAQISLNLPSAITGLFQGLLLFYLLAADLFIHYRIVTTPKTVPVS